MEHSMVCTRGQITRCYISIQVYWDISLLCLSRASVEQLTAPKMPPGPGPSELFRCRRQIADALFPCSICCYIRQVFCTSSISKLGGYYIRLKHLSCIIHIKTLLKHIKTLIYQLKLLQFFDYYIILYHMYEINYYINYITSIISIIFISVYYCYYPD